MTQAVAYRRPATGAHVPVAAAWLTVELVLWVGLCLLATMARLWDLGGQPLETGEAATALASWRILQGVGGSVGEGPLMVYGNLLIFMMLGANDASARLLPAVAGIVLVAIPYLLRRQLGRWGALIAALFLAVSPTLLYFARSVDGQSLVAAAALLTLACLIKYREGSGRCWLYALATAFGLLALTGRDAYTVLAVFALALVISGPVWLRGETNEAGTLDPAAMKNAGLLAAGVVILGSTGLLANLHGIQEGLITPLERWVTALKGGGEDWTFQLQTLAVYEPAVLLFGVIGAAAAMLRRDRGLPRFLVLWAAVALVVTSFSRERPGSSLALAIVPLALLAGPLVVDVVAGLRALVPQHRLAVYLGAMLSLLALFWLATAFFTLSGQSLPQTVRVGPFTLSPRMIGDAIVPIQLVLLAVALVALGAWIGLRRLPRLLALLALVVFTVVTFRAAALLGYATNASPAELQVKARTLPDIRSLAGDVADTRDVLLTNQSPQKVWVTAPQRQLLEWYLRNEQPSFGLPAQVGEGLIVAAGSAEPPPGQYAGQRYQVQSSWGGRAQDLGKFWRWLTLRDVPTPVRFDEVRLYVPTTGE